MRPLFSELKLRGMVDQYTHEALVDILNQDSVVFYVGFDPTADSFHVGQLAIFNLMRFLHRAGHKPILMMGAATGMIGDPSGKQKERVLLDLETIENNIRSIEQQMLKLLPPIEDNKPLLLNNYTWLGKKLFLEFLRDIGKHFSVNQMVARDAVASRFQREGEGITYTEFSYILLQAYDFYELNKDHQCVLQLGGSDQWGNIVSGVDLTRRLSQKQVYGLTTPLLTKADGTKFGKSEGGAIWLDRNKTSPYQLYQYFINQSDADVIRLLKVLTMVPLEEIDQLEQNLVKEGHLRNAQKRLAEEVVSFLHGPETLAECIKASRAFFESNLDELKEDWIDQVFFGVPSLEIDRQEKDAGLDPLEILVKTKLSSSKGEARKLLKAGGFYVNNQSWPTEDKIPAQLWLYQRFLVLRQGKKNYFLLRQTA